MQHNGYWYNFLIKRELFIPFNFWFSLKYITKVVVIIHFIFFNSVCLFLCFINIYKSEFNTSCTYFDLFSAAIWQCFLVNVLQLFSTSSHCCRQSSLWCDGCPPKTWGKGKQLFFCWNYMASIICHLILEKCRKYIA